MKADSHCVIHVLPKELDENVATFHVQLAHSELENPFLDVSVSLLCQDVILVICD